MKIYDLIGIGIGPSNLSTAALIHPHREEVSSIFFERNLEFRWYPGMLFPSAKMQVSFLKDLVTMVDPTNEFSFLNFLKDTGRLYMFASKGMSQSIRRIEFEQYFKWVIDQLSNLRFGSLVERVKYSKGMYEVVVNGTVYYARNLSVGAGMKAKVPDFCKNRIDDNIVHSIDFLTKKVDTKDQVVTVVGSGQSATEIILSLLNNADQQPAKIHWICSSYNLLPLEDTPFSNELYTPNYSDYFYHLDKSIKPQLIDMQKYTSDGISAESLTELYNKLYDLRCIEKKDLVRFHFHSYLMGLDKVGDKLNASVFLKDHNQTTGFCSDAVILCTGLTNERPKCLEPLEDLLVFEDNCFDVDEDFAIKTTIDLEGDLFLHNGAKHVRGVADPNLSLLAWRSAKIINRVLGRNVYDTDIDQAFLGRGVSVIHNQATSLHS
jgi:lysine N6-hydroxylase